MPVMMMEVVMVPLLRDDMGRDAIGATQQNRINPSKRAFVIFFLPTDATLGTFDQRCLSNTDHILTVRISTYSCLLRCVCNFAQIKIIEAR